MRLRRRGTRAAIQIAILSALPGAVSILAPTTAFGQTPTPIGPLVLDARGVAVALPNNGAAAAPRELQAADLPSRGFGFEVGAHAFPFRTRLVTVGVGATLLWSGRTREPDPELGTGPAVSTRLSAFSPQLSLNFGSGRGWSYISGGIGTASISISRDDRPEEDGQRARALNYGAGARWFFSDALAFTFDIRFLSVAGKEPAGTSLGFPKNTYFVAGAGVSVKPRLR